MKEKILDTLYNISCVAMLVSIIAFVMYAATIGSDYSDLFEEAKGVCYAGEVANFTYEAPDVFTTYTVVFVEGQDSPLYVSGHEYLKPGSHIAWLVPQLGYGVELFDTLEDCRQSIVDASQELADDKYGFETFVQENGWAFMLILVAGPLMYTASLTLLARHNHW